ncbi:MAG: ABC transporter permease [Oscillospiraceae bacterium]|nr:ABC transporter permease [Oscillospiraceae bacterium]
MKQFAKVFKFEFLNIIRSKAFIFLTLILFIGSTAVLFYPRFSNSQKAPLIGESKPSKLAVFDTVGELGEYIKENMTSYEVILCKDETEAAALLKDNTVDASITISSPLSYTYSVNDMSLYDETAKTVSELLQFKYRETRLAEFGLTESQIAEIQSAVTVPEIKIVGNDQAQSFLYTYILLFMLYMAVIAYGQMIAQSVATEKSSRAMELLITSAKPDSLIFGKVLGTGFAGLSQMLVILLWALLCYRINAPFWADNFLVASIFDMPVSLIIYTAVFFVLGFLIYAFLYGAFGSLASKMEDLSTLTTPLTFLMVIAFIVPITSISSGNVDSGLMKVLSFIPFCSPMAMFARIAMSTVNPLHIAISIIILILSNIGIGYIAVLIYRMGILMYGKPPKITQVLKQLKK